MHKAEGMSIERAPMKFDLEFPTPEQRGFHPQPKALCYPCHVWFYLV